jgi:RNA polymerase sigma-70 factor, ECF subfamily
MSDIPIAVEAPGSSEERVSPETSWPELVDRIRSGDPRGMEGLYAVLSKGVRFLLCRQLGPQDLDDKVHDVFLIVAQAIRNGDLREPERLMGYVRTVVRRQVAGHIDVAVHTRRSEIELDASLPLRDGGSTPEQIAIAQQNQEIALRMLNSVSSRDREILVRFYLEEQTQDQICQDMGLTDTQFRLIKSRAKARFGELGKQRLARRSMPRW